MMVLLVICWILEESSVSPPACPILRELQSAVCNPQSRTATRGEGWAWCVRGCRAHHATGVEQLTGPRGGAGVASLLQGIILLLALH